MPPMWLCEMKTNLFTDKLIRFRLIKNRPPKTVNHNYFWVCMAAMGMGAMPSANPMMNMMAAMMGSMTTTPGMNPAMMGMMGGLGGGRKPKRWLFSPSDVRNWKWHLFSGSVLAHQISRFWCELSVVSIHSFPDPVIVAVNQGVFRQNIWFSKTQMNKIWRDINLSSRSVS